MEERSDEIGRRSTRGRRIGSIVSVLAVLLFAVATASAQEAHPNDHKIVFFQKPDREAKELILHQVQERFLVQLASDRARARRICIESPLWSVPFLVDMVEGRVKAQPIQQWNSVLTLASIVDPRAARTLRISAQRHEHAQVTAFACLALGVHGGPESLEVLIDVLEDGESREVVIASILALARFGGEEAEKAILAVAERPENDRTRNVALVALGMFPCSRTMEVARMNLRDKKTGVVRRSVLALGNAAFGPLDARREEMLELFEKGNREGGIRALALLALARYEGWRTGTLVLGKALRDRDSEVVEIAARALQHRGDPRARKDILRKIAETVDGDAKLAARLLLGLAEIESRHPTEEGLEALVSKLGARGAPIRIYTAIALTRIGEGFDDYPKLRARALGMLRAALAGKGGSLGDEARTTFRRAVALLDPENPPSEVPEEWGSIWDDDPILPTIGETLHDVFLEKTNWYIAEELQIHSIRDVPISRANLEKGTARVISIDNEPLRDLREWLKEKPYITPAQLPDRGYGE